MQPQTRNSLEKRIRTPFGPSTSAILSHINGWKLTILSLYIWKEYKRIKNDKIWRFIASGRKRADFLIHFSVFRLIASHLGTKWHMDLFSIHAWSMKLIYNLISSVIHEATKHNTHNKIVETIKRTLRFMEHDFFSLLQHVKVQNIAARIVLGLRKYDHISEGRSNDIAVVHRCLIGV